ncbi:MAG: hypothetical protein J6S67_17775 [Methanobrevibacter sp.]|nr:hypothetical protein [Methanobrevibacter sp.]
MDKTIIIFGDGKQITIDGKISISGTVGVDIEQEITEVVDDMVVYCYTVKNKEVR